MAFNTTGDMHGHVAELFEDHHPEHGGTWADTVGGPSCHAVQANMDFSASQKSTDVIEGILNSPRGTPLQRLHAQGWLNQRKPQEQSWLDRMFAMVGLAPDQKIF